VNKLGVIGASIAAALLAASANAAPQHFVGGKYLKLAKVSLQEARTVALKARPGIITDQELEKEKGGTGLRYSFDIRSGDGVHEVGVDARTGAVLENSKEGPKAD
jgi:uncharacterized membrane protein YkoI